VSLPNTLTISVTQDHINNGKKKDCNKCPIALATMDLLDYEERPFVSVRVDTNTLDVKEEEGQYYTTYYLPQIAKDFIRIFDNENHVEPIEFTAYQVNY
jgi:hypothetical protein